MYSHDVMRRARRLSEVGFSDAEVAREIGVHCNTVGRWRRGETVGFGPPVVHVPWRPPHAGIYAYLLGVYLGDGHVTVAPSGKGGPARGP